MTPEERIKELEAKRWVLEFKLLIKAEKEAKRLEEELNAPKTGFFKWSHWKCHCPVYQGKKRCRKVCYCKKPSNRCSCKQWVAFRKEDPILDVQAPPTPAVIGKRTVWLA